jgi:hypothetical protein
MKQLLFVLFSTAGLASALDFGMGVGVKGGVPFTDLLETTGVLTGTLTSLSRSDNYIVGPVVELRLPFGFAIEADGLYRGTTYTLTTPGSPSVLLKSSTWEIPYLAKFRFPIPLIKPFILAGGAYRIFNDIPSNVPVSHNAFVAGGGIELKIHKLRLSGEARYLYWGQPPPTPLVRVVRSQGEVLFGLIF